MSNSSQPAERRAVAPVVSVVIIFLNGEKFLRDAIESVVAQTLADWELFLVDDGSTDSSTEIAKSYAARFPGQIEYLEHEGHRNEGMSASRNLGISRARGEFVALLDADDIWFPDKLQRQLAILRAHPDAAMLAAPAMNWYSDGTKSIQPMTVEPGMLPPGAWIPKILEKDDNTANPSSVLLWTSALRAVGGFEASFKGPLMVFEDQVTWFKVTLAAPVYFHPEPVIFYRVHSESCCVSTPSDLQVAGRIVLYARLADFIRTSTGPAPKKGILRAMVRTRLGELRLRAERHHLELANRLDSTGIVNRQTPGVLAWFPQALGVISKSKAIALSTKIFNLLTMAYYEGPLSSVRAVPGLVLAASRSLVDPSHSR